MNDDPVGTPSPGTTGHRADVGWERATLEKLAFSALAEQRSARRWAIVWRLMWLLLAGSVVWVVFFSGEGVSSPRKPHTALIEIRGEIAAGAEASADNVVGSLKAAFEDAGAQAVVLLIDSTRRQYRSRPASSTTRSHGSRPCTTRRSTRSV